MSGDILIAIPSTAYGGATATGTLVSTDYDVTEYQSGVLISNTNGNLIANDPPVGLPYNNGAATYLVILTRFYSDGAEITNITPIELDAVGNVRTVEYTSPSFSLSCRDVAINVQNINVPVGTNYNPFFFDGNFGLLQQGSEYIGSIPVLQNPQIPFQIGFDVGLDVAQWSDIPSNIDSPLCAFGCVFIEC